MTHRFKKARKTLGNKKALMKRRALRRKKLNKAAKNISVSKLDKDLEEYWIKNNDVDNGNKLNI